MPDVLISTIAAITMLPLLIVLVLAGLGWLYTYFTFQIQGDD